MSGSRNSPPSRSGPRIARISNTAGASTLRGSCRVHGTRYPSCPLDLIEAERASSGLSFRQIVGGIIFALLFLLSVLL
jgi:hypothetical protein